jgi:hypothetical protein
MGLAGLVGTGGPGGCGEHDGIDPLAYTVHEWTYDAAWERFQNVWWMDQALFCATFDGSRMGGDGETRKNTEKDGEVGKIGVAQFLRKASSKRGVTHQFLCTMMDRVALFGMVEQVHGNILRRYFVMMQ